MKKFRLTILTLFICFLSAVNVGAAVIDNAEIVEKTVNNTTADVVVIKGTDPWNEIDKKVTITVLNRGFAFSELATANQALISSYILNTAVVRTDDKGEYVWEFVMNGAESTLDDENTKYTVCVNVGGVFETKKLAYFSHGTRVNIIKEYINKSTTAEELFGNIGLYGEILGSDTEYYSLLNDKSAVSKILYKYLPYDETTTEEFNKSFLMSSIVQAFNEKKVDGIIAALNDYGTEKMAECAELLKDVKPESLSSAVDEIASKASADFNVFESTVKLITVKYALCHNVIEGYAHVEDVLKFSGIDLSVYNSATNRQYINSRLTSAAFSSFEQLEGIISSLAELKYIAKPSLGGGGGNSSSGRDVISSSGAVAPTVNTEPVATQKPIKLIYGFSDIESVSWAHEAIGKLSQNNIVSGMGDNIFAPDDNITREQFALLIKKAFNLTHDADESAFSDITKSSWSYDGVMACYENGIVNGIGDGSFGANYAISREDMAVMLYRTAIKMNLMKENAASNSFADVSDFGEYSHDAAANLAKAGVLNGTGDNKFNPKGNATRAQAVVAIYRLMNVEEVADFEESGEDEERLLEVSLNSYIKLLSRLGIISDKTEENIPDTVTRADFARAVLKIMHIEFNPSDKETLKYYGFNDDELSAPMTYGEAAKVIVTMLGYSDIIKDQDSNAYILKANELEVFSGVSKSGDDSMFFGDMVKIIQNMLQAERMEWDYSEGSGKLIQSEENLLEKNFDVKIVRGVVTKNEYTSLYDNTKTGKNNIEINNVLYTTSFEESKYYLGYSVVAYIFEDEEIIFLKKDKKNSDFTVGTDAEITYENYTYRYYNANNKPERVEIGDSVVIYNQQLLSEYSPQYMSPKNGEVTFIDNDNDGECEVVKITAYGEGIVVSYTQPQLYRVYDKYNEGKYETLDESSVGKVEIVNPEGARVKFSDIAIGQTISIAKSYNETLITAVVSNEAIYGDFESMSMDMVNGYYTMTVSNKEYRISENAYNNFGKGLTYGQTYKFLLDYFGNIVDAEESGFGIYKYAYMINAWPDAENGDPDTYVFKLFTSEGKFENVKNIAGKIRVNGETMKTADALMRNISDGSTVESQLVRYKVNSEGKLTEIILTGSNCNIPTDKIYKKYEGTYTYITGSKMFYGKAPLSDNCVVFTVPSDPKNSDIGKFGIGSSYLGGKMAIKGYVTDEDALSVEALVAERNSDALSGGMILTVASVSIGVNEEDTECYVLTGPAYDGTNTSEVTAYIDRQLLSEINPGDIIRYTILNNNMINNAVMLYDYDVLTSTGTVISKDSDGNSISDGIGYPDTTNYSNEFVATMSYIQKRENSILSVNRYPKTADEYSSSDDIIYRPEGAPIYRVYTDGGKCFVEKATASQIPDASTGMQPKTFIITKYGNVKYCIVYE